jgi:putative DNA primase/helicase
MSQEPTEKELDQAMQKSRESNFKYAFREEEKRKTVCYQIASYLIEKYSAKSIGGERTREVFIYKEGIYIEGANVLRQNIRNVLEELCTTYYIKEIIETIKDRTFMDRKNFNVDVNLINFNNGILDIRTRMLTPHDSQHLFFSKFPLDYKEEADCPNIKKFISEVFNEEENKVMLIQELFGYCLYRRYFIKKAINLLGKGDTGKTTLINLLIAFVGKENMSGVGLQQLCADKFSAANLYGKHLNIYDDLPFDNVKDNGKFKIATGGGFITGEKKFYDQFVFENYAKLVFACNKIPEVDDTNDNAYFNRWVIIEFNRIFNPSEQDKQLIHKLTTPEELSGLLNFALDGLDRLLDRERFSYEKEVKEIKAEMSLSSSPVAQFTHEYLEFQKDGWISKEEMHSIFIDYARTNNFPADTIEEFGKKLPKFADYLYTSRKQMNNPATGRPKQFTGWRNVKLKEGILKTPTQELLKTP